MAQRVAIVGAGVSGLAAAHYLAPHHEVTLFEANEYLGGHTHTHDIDVDGEAIRVDTGFIVYNERTYPGFIRLLDELGCKGHPTEMSFSVRDEAADLEYNGHSARTLFAQRRNLFRPAFLRLIRDILRFNEAVRDIGLGDTRTLDDFLADEGFSDAFRRWYIVPMAAAIWSTGDAGINAFPISALAAFFINHGLVDLRDRPQWYTVDGGSDRYVDAIRARLRDVVVGDPVRSISRSPSDVTVRTAKVSRTFDQIVIATHADDALGLLADPSAAEAEILGAITYSTNEACLHSDTREMPRRRRAWASWNYLIDPGREDAATLTYDMNRLQHLPTSTPVLVTLNDGGRVDPTRIIRRLTYSHPFFDHHALAAQRRKQEISAKRRTSYAGAYWGYGFHEDGVQSALDVVRHLLPCRR